MVYMNNDMLTIDLDLSWDDTNPADGFGPVLEEIARVAPTSFVKVNQFVGAGGGWPDVTVLVARGEAEALLKVLGWDEADIAEVIEN